MEYINGNEDRRHYSVSKMGKDVYVREVAKGANSFTLTREQAWARAQRLRTLEQPKKRIRGSKLIYVDLGKTTTELEWPEENLQETVDNDGESCHTAPMTNSTPSEAQVTLFNKLLTELLTLGGKDGSYDKGFGPTVDRQAASAAIKAAIQAVQEAKRAQTQPIQPLVAPEVPVGRYAVTDNEGTLRFFKLDRPTEGRWAGYTFLKMMASDETYPVRDKAKRDRIIAKIAQNVQEAMITYGREIGACGHCGRTLTQEESRERGIGPICAQNMGW